MNQHRRQRWEYGSPMDSNPTQQPVDESRATTQQDSEDPDDNLSILPMNINLGQNLMMKMLY